MRPVALLIAMALLTNGCVAVQGKPEPCPCVQSTMAPSGPATAENRSDDE
jgi:hypothetical protein